MAEFAERLVGRADEIGSMEAALGELERGRSVTLELVGEPGIGKTRLLAELAARADARGFLVLGGCAAELERDLPFWVFVDALDEYVAGLEPHRLGALGDDVVGELATILPSLSGPAAERQVALQHERYRSHLAVRELLELLARSQPLLLMLDDLHWGDPASVELLGALLRRPPAAPVLLALAVRPRQVRERLAASLERAHRAGTLTRLDLGALTPGEARELLGDRVDLAASDLYEESGGNPFYLEQLARTYDRPGRVAPTLPETALGAAEVPPTVVAALAEELTLLSDRARRILEGAAVAGDPFDPELASAAAGAREPATLDPLDELLRLDLVRQTNVPRRFRFRHPLVRRAVYEATPGGWRLSAHERTAEALSNVARRPPHAPTTSSAPLARATSPPSRPCARPVRWPRGARPRAPRAGSRARFGSCLRLPRPRSGSSCSWRWPGHWPPPGSSPTGTAPCSRASSSCPQESVALRVRLTTACAGVEHLLGRHEQAHARLATALRTLPDSDAPEAVALMIELAVDGFYRMDYESMRGWAGRAVAAARPLDDRPLTAAAVAVLAQAHALTGAIAEGEMHRSEAAALVDALDDDELALRLDAPANLAAAEIDLDRLAEAEAHAERAMAVGRATGQSDFIPVLILCLGWIKRLRGKLAEGGELLDGAAESARLSGNAQSLAGNLLNRSLTALAAGDVATALTTAEESVDLMRPLDRGLMSASTGLALAAALLESGDAARAVDVLVGPAGGDELPLVPGAWRANWLELLTRCWLALGRRGEAARAAAGAEAAAAGGRHLARSLADRAAAAVVLDSGDAVSGARLALASAAAADEVGVPIEAALSRTLAGRALARADQTGLALAELERAAAELHACGAVRYRDQAERELRQLGHRVHRRTRPGKADGSGLASLTGRELQVAMLVGDLKTNPEIAAALFLSRKTVESHVRNIFMKLGVSSRAEIARTVERADRRESLT